MCGVDVKNSIFVFTLLKVWEMFGGFSVFLYEFGYDRFNASVKSSFLAKSC